MAYIDSLETSLNRHRQTMHSQIELSAFDPMLVRNDGRKMAPPVAMTCHSRLTAVTSDDCPLTCHMPRPQHQQAPPPHACCYNSALTLPRCHGNLVSFDLSPMYAGGEVMDYSPLHPTHSPLQCNGVKPNDEDMEARKPLTCNSSNNTPDVVENTSVRAMSHVKLGTAVDRRRYGETGCACGQSRCGVVACVVMAMLVLCSCVIAAVLIINEYPSLSSKLVQGGCFSDSDCAQYERCLPADTQLTSLELVNDAVPATPPTAAAAAAAGVARRCGCRRQCDGRYEPVCGSDANTYHNQCQLQLRACLTRAIIAVKARGKCVVSNPCAGVTCPFEGQCVPSHSPANASGVCRCIFDCPPSTSPSLSPPSSSLLSAVTSSSAVCGSDDVTYTSQCELRRHSCVSKLNISVVHPGPCDACRQHRCPPLMHCVTDSVTGHAHCQCTPADRACQSHHQRRRHTAVDPVCASDHVTYVNTCHMQVAACRQQQTLSVLHKGQCQPVGQLDGCGEHQCQMGAVCQWRAELARPACVCPSCPGEFAPVCASDGRSYNSECKLRLEACETKRPLRVQYRGMCRGCEKKHCPNYGICESSPTGGATCVCPRTCVPRSDPVCGIDGVTYANQCEMKVAACNKQQFITVGYRGKCDLCDNVKCHHGAVCLAGRCICPLECPSTASNNNNSSISNNNNNKSRQTFRLSTSRHPNGTRVLGAEAILDEWPGVEDEWSAVEDEWSAVEDKWPGVKEEWSEEDEGPVCGTDMITYASRCHLEMAACESVTSRPLLAGSQESLELSVRHLGACQTREILASQSTATNTHTLLCRNIRCEHGATCTVTVNGMARCACLQKCSGHHQMAAPVCGSDLRLYRSACHMRMHECLAQTTLHRRPLVLCERPTIESTESNEKLCLGLEPLINQTASESSYIRCLEDNYCPSGSFCHRAQLESVCCSIKHTTIEPNITDVAMETDTIDSTEETVGDCYNTTDVCCPDGKTLPPGGDLNNCPISCNCHRLGALFANCTSDGRCQCRTGVSGDRCDRCAVNHWGLQNIEFGYTGCQPCKCNQWGSVRHDCEQSRGRCVCRRAIRGDKCDICTDGSRITADNPCRLFDDDDDVAAAAATTARHRSADGPLAEAFVSRPASGQFRNSPLADQAQVSDASASVQQPFVAAFHGRSYLELKPARSWLHLYLDVELISYEHDGLIFYRQPLKPGDRWNANATLPNSLLYESLAIIDGYITYSYNVNRDPVTLRSREPLTNNEYHRIRVRRYHSDAQLSIDDRDHVRQGGATSARLTTAPQMPLYIGYLPEELLQSINLTAVVKTQRGFHGCIRRLRVDQSETTDVALAPSAAGDVTASQSVTRCESRRCELRPCSVGRLCVDEPDGQYSCHCKTDSKGFHVDRRIRAIKHQTLCLSRTD